MTEGSLRLLIEPDDREVAGAGYLEVTVGTSLTSDEFGSILFLDFPGSPWTIDFATIDRQDMFHNGEGVPDRAKLLEYQLHLTVADFEAGIKARKQFLDLGVAAGVRVADDSDRSEHMLAKWRAGEVRWDDELGWPTGGAQE